MVSFHLVACLNSMSDLGLYSSLDPREREDVVVFVTTALNVHLGAAPASSSSSPATTQTETNAGHSVSIQILPALPSLRPFMRKASYLSALCSRCRSAMSIAMESSW